MLGDIGRVVLAATLVGVGVTAAYSLAVLAMARTAEARRASHGAGAWPLIATLATLATLAFVGAGLYAVIQSG